MPGSNEFVLRLLTDKSVLPRARAIGLARILCRADIVTHLATNSGNVRNGGLPVHMRSVAMGAETALRQSSRQPHADRARRRHSLTGVRREQLMYVWVSMVDAYASAALLAGYRPSERERWGYMSAAKAFGHTFGLSELPGSLTDVQSRLDRFMNRIPSSAVPAQRWGDLAQVVRSDWFSRDSSVTLGEVVEAVQLQVPGRLVEALRR